MCFLGRPVLCLQNMARVQSDYPELTLGLLVEKGKVENELVLWRLIANVNEH